MTNAASPLARHAASPSELKERFDAAREGTPFLIYRDAGDRQRILMLGEALERLTIGRRRSNDIALESDAEVSRVHAELERIGEDWTVADDGLSSNGTFVGGVRIRGRRRLRDGDEIRVGATVIAFCAPARGESRTTLVRNEVQAPPRLTDTQRAVLVSLARPYKESSGFATPATNKEVAAALVMSVDGVKSALRSLCRKFDVEGLPQNEKRVRLVERAFQLGVLDEDDL